MFSKFQDIVPRAGLGDVHSTLQPDLAFRRGRENFTILTQRVCQAGARKCGTSPRSKGGTRHVLGVVPRRHPSRKCVVAFHDSWYRAMDHLLDCDVQIFSVTDSTSLTAGSESRRYGRYAEGIQRRTQQERTN